MSEFESEPESAASSEILWPQTLMVDEAAVGKRLDAYLASRFPSYSRTAVQRAIAAGQVVVVDQEVKPALRLELGWTIHVAGIETTRSGPEPEDIPLDILYEDDWLVAVNKPAGMVVHPAKGHWQGTLAAALAFRFGELSTTGGTQRPGIVHRLDRDTSGVIVVARHDRAHEALAAQFKDRTTEKEYWAIVRGVPDRDADAIDKPIGPHPKLREAMAIRPGHPESKEALTTFEVLERFKRFSLLKVLPKTGRTHQIRVHLTSIGLPILCDKLYGGSDRVTAEELKREYKGTPPSSESESVLMRQALHARRLSITHPQSGKRMVFEAPLPEDMVRVLEYLRA